MMQRLYYEIIRPEGSLEGDPGSLFISCLSDNQCLDEL
jgi:hypothetical protein